MLHLAGSRGGGLAAKYKNQGLRVIAVDVDLTQLALSEEKWKGAGADFYLYYDDGMVCFKKVYGRIGGFPTSKLIKEWKDIGTHYAEIKEQTIKGAFGFK